MKASFPLKPIIASSMENLLVQDVGSLEIVQQRFKKWKQFVQGIMTWLPSLDVLAVVIQV